MIINYTILIYLDNITYIVIMRTSLLASDIVFLVMNQTPVWGGHNDQCRPTLTEFTKFTENRRNDHIAQRKRF